MIDEEKKRRIKAIVSVFETGSPTPDYGAVAFLADGAGITYGVHQATDRSGALGAILDRFEALAGPDYPPGLLRQIKRWRLGERTYMYDYREVPEWVGMMMMGLSELGRSHPDMQAAQDHVFDRDYWRPAYATWTRLGLTEPLSLAVIYDSTIHGSFTRVRKLFPELPPSQGGSETEWTRAYLDARRGWLRSKGGILARTVYRVDALIQLADAGRWDLNGPLTVRGQVIP